MNRYIKYLIILTVILLATQNRLTGQVTIGSSDSPATGALLQLKQNEANNINSTKGLNTPRVSVTTTTPAIGQLAQSIGSTGTWDEANHEGMVVYNTNECVNNTGMDNGLYMWNGTEWISLQKSPSPPDVQKFTDPRDGEIYLYRSFGSDAGVWMLENMRYIDVSFTASAGSGSSLSTDRFYAYPNAQASTPGTAPSSWKKTQGLIYTYAAATLGVQDGVSVNQSEGQSGEGPTTPIQGICPVGWHIPSDSEWNRLEREIYNNPKKYSTYTGSSQFNPNVWNNTWNTNYASRGSDNGNGHGFAMQSPCQVPGVSGTTSGTSLPASLGGFCALLVGRAGGAFGGSIVNYGEFTSFWSSSTNTIDTSWFRFLNLKSLGNSNPPYQVERAASSRTYMLSVRCKRDN